MKNSVKKISFAKLASIVLVIMMMFALSVSAFAANEEDTAAQTAQTQQEETGKSTNGLGLIAAAVVTGLAGIGGGLAIAAAAPAAIAATSEDPKSFGKSLIFVALGESIALFGVVISILILNKI